MFETGNPVTESEFFGQEALVNKLIALLSEERSNNIEINGLARVGKTSLVREAVRRLQQSAANNRVFVEYQCNKRNSLSCFAALADEIERLLYERAFRSEDAVSMRGSINSFRESLNSIGTLSEKHLKNVLIFLKNSYRITICLIMDNADDAPDNFGSSIEAFAPLMEFTTCFSVVSISRAGLTKLFEENGSKYTCRFQHHYLIKASDNDFSELYKTKMYELYHREVNADCWKLIDYYCGGNPYFLALFCNMIIENTDDGNLLNEIRSFHAICNDYIYTIDKWRMFFEKYGVSPDLYRWLANKNINVQTARDYGFIKDNNMPAIPYINEAWAPHAIASTGAVNTDQLSALLTAIRALLVEHKTKVESHYGRGVDSETLRIKRLRAIESKIQTNLILTEYNTDITVPISDSELDEYSHYFDETRLAFEKI